MVLNPCVASTSPESTLDGPPTTVPAPRRPFELSFPRVVSSNGSAATIGTVGTGAPIDRAALAQSGLLSVVVWVSEPLRRVPNAVDATDATRVTADVVGVAVTHLISVTQQASDRNGTALRVGVAINTTELRTFSGTFHVVLSVPPGLFECPPAFGHLRIDFEIASPPPEPVVPAQVMDATQVAVTAVSTAGALAANPVVAMNINKIAAVSALQTCVFSHYEPLPRLTSLTGMGFGAARGYYYRGGVIGNLLLFAGIVVFFVTVSVLLLLFRRRTLKKGQHRANSTPLLRQVYDSFADTHFPSVMVIPTAIAYQGTASVSLSIFIHSEDQRDVAYGVFGGLCCLLFTGMIAYLCTAGFRCVIDKRAAVDDDHTDERRRRRSKSAQLYEYMLESHDHWRARDGEKMWKRRWHFFFADFRRSWWLPYEFVIITVCGLVDGVRISDRRVCLALAYCPTVAFGLTCALALALKPAFNRFNSWFIIAFSSMSCVLGICAVIQLHDGSIDFQESTEWLGYALLIFGAIKSTVDISLAIHWVITRRREVRAYLNTGDFLKGMTEEDLARANASFAEDREEATEMGLLAPVQDYTKPTSPNAPGEDLDGMWPAFERPRGTPSGSTPSVEDAAERGSGTYDPPRAAAPHPPRPVARSTLSHLMDQLLSTDGLTGLGSPFGAASAVPAPPTRYYHDDELLPDDDML